MEQFKLILEDEGGFIRVTSRYGAPPYIEIFTEDVDTDFTSVYLSSAEAAELGRALLEAAGVPDDGLLPLAVIDRRLAEEHTKLREARRAVERLREVRRDMKQLREAASAARELES